MALVVNLHTPLVVSVGVLKVIFQDLRLRPGAVQ